MKDRMHALMKRRGTNQLDELTDGLVNAIKFSDPDVVYPDMDDVKEGDGVKAEWFYGAYKSPNDFAELTAILQYVTQEAMFEDVGEMMLGIALVEMKHYDKLGDLISSLGGELKQDFNVSAVAYGKTAHEAVQLGVAAEKSAIAEYRRLTKLVEALAQNRTTEVVLQLLAKLIADETFHLNLFEEWLRNNPK